jgi:hypothetical protein
MGSSDICKLVAGLSLVTFTSSTFAQDAWKFTGTLTSMQGDYKDALTMNSQSGKGLKVTSEYKEQWGLTAGLQSTRINSPQPIPETRQDNWLLSGHVHIPSQISPGRWTLQIDGHQINNNTKVGNSDGVRVIAPQIAWLSSQIPLKLDISYASSSYRDMPTVHQISSGIGFGFNNNRNWLQIRGYVINQLDSTHSLSYATTRASEVKLTQFFPQNVSLIPTSITVGFERGQKIYNVDMLTQTVYNLPMLNEGGESIAANWKISQDSDFVLHASTTRYAAAFPMDHQFKLHTLSAQLKTTW